MNARIGPDRPTHLRCAQIPEPGGGCAVDRPGHFCFFGGANEQRQSRASGGAPPLFLRGHPRAIATAGSRYPLRDDFPHVGTSLSALHFLPVPVKSLLAVYFRALRVG